MGTFTFPAIGIAASVDFTYESSTLLINLYLKRNSALKSRYEFVKSWPAFVLIFVTMFFSSLIIAASTEPRERGVSSFDEATPLNRNTTKESGEANRIEKSEFAIALESEGLTLHGLKISDDIAVAIIKRKPNQFGETEKKIATDWIGTKLNHARVEWLNQQMKVIDEKNLSPF